MGGKFHVAEKLVRFIPGDISQHRYFEPFLGAGSLFLALQHPNAYLSDLNGHLIDCYKMIRDDPGAVHKELKVHASNDSEEYYYKIRDLYNRSRRGKARAGRFIYLNRTGFNGVFRVNRQGAYNVPYGNKASPRFPTEKELVDVARSLMSAELSTADYTTALKRAKAGDFVYLDPPYPPLNGTSFFTHYTSDRFGTSDQASVADCVRELDRKGCRVMVSNADTRAIRTLYKGFKITSLSVVRFVSSSAMKHRVGELIITNYPLPKKS